MTRYAWALGAGIVAVALLWGAAYYTGQKDATDEIDRENDAAVGEAHEAVRNARECRAAGGVWQSFSATCRIP